LFVERQQALLHGDLHTGSWMVTQETTYAIDPEFATYGPIAFDVCKMLANLLLAFFAADGHAVAEGESRAFQQQWMLQVLLLVS
jgi:5-methylthioribose kinase